MGEKDFGPSRFIQSDTEHRIQVVDQQAQQESKLGGCRQGHKIMEDKDLGPNYCKSS